MAKFTKWIDRVGEQKEVQGFIFTLFDNDGDKVIAEVNDELYEMSRATWRNGKFTKILRILKPKYIGETKIINNMLFTIKECAEKRVKVFIEGCKECYDMAVSTWKNGKFYKNAMKFFREHGYMTDSIQEDEETKFFPAVISDKPISSEIIKKHITTLENTLYYKEFKMLFNKLAGIYHPDKGGNPKLFQEIHAIYKLQAPVLKRCKKLEQEAQDGKMAKDDYEALMQGIIKAEKSKQDWYNFRARYGC